MRALLITLLFIVTSSLCQAQGVPPKDVRALLQRAEAIRAEAQALIGDLEAMRPVGASGVSASSFTDIFDEIKQAVHNLNLTMEELQKLLKTTSSTVEGVGKATETQIAGVGTAVQAQITKLGDRLDQNLKDLNASIDQLLVKTNAFIGESTATLHDIRVASEKTVDFFDRLDGTLMVGMYGTKDGVDSEAALTLWYRMGAGGTHEFLTIGVTDMETSAKLDLEGGVMRGPLTLGLGFIEDGVGASLSYNPSSRAGLDVRTSVHHLRDPLLDVKVGYTLSSKIRPFVFVDDILHDGSFGGGISYGVGF